MKAILLGAGQGTRLRPLTDDRPKCMVEVDGTPLLTWQLHALRAAGVDDVVVVRGWCRTAIRGDGLRFVDNPDFATTNMLESLRRARSEMHGDVLIAYTDLLYRPEVAQAARESRADIGVVVDLDWRSLWERRMDDPLSDAETLRTDGHGRLLEIGQPPSGYEQIEAQYLGLVRLSPAGCEVVRDALDHAAANPDTPAFGSPRGFARAYLTDLLHGLAQRGTVVKTIPIRGGWTEVDSLDDLAVAEAIVHEQRWSRPVAEPARVSA